MPGMEEEAKKEQIHRGLKGVNFDRSAVCDIDGRAGELRYRGYSIHDLAERSTFEETCHLLFMGELPTREQLAHLAQKLKQERRLPPAIYEVIRTVKAGPPDGRAAHRGFGARGLRPGGGRQLARGDPAQGHPPHLPGADDRGRARAHPQRA
jgi:citrate synthase